MNKKTPLLLIILDGYANNPCPIANAAFTARTPTIDRIWQYYPKTELLTYGNNVGLPEGQMGNSEVGHLNIGAGRVVEQELTRINKAIKNDQLTTLAEFKNLIQEVLKNENSCLHLIGLVSTGGVHSYLDHLQALILKALQQGLKRIIVHVITDGRDRPPTASIEDLNILSQFIDLQRKNFPDCDLHLGSIIGRYFAMDRDKRWDRTQKAYDLYTLGEGELSTDPITSIKTHWKSGQTDEFIEPIYFEHSTIKDNDTLLFFNFRADRMRQLVSSFLDQQGLFVGFQRQKQLQLAGIYTLTEYDETFPVHVLFKPFIVKHHLGQVVSAAGMSQLRIAETEKYAHVTYFFNGGEETPSPNEERVLVPSPRDVATYDLKPEMSAYTVTEKLIEKLNQGETDFVVLNFANCDMVGHTGNFQAAVKAIETVDACLAQILEWLTIYDGQAIITADHGNADQMINYQTSEPHTFHTMHPVPLILVSKKYLGQKLHSGGSLCDIAPTICDILGLKQPEEMTGKSLLK